MDNFTWVDGGAALIILLSAILAYSRGLVREGMAIVGWIGAAVVAFFFAGPAMPIVRELPVVGKFLADSCELSVVAAFAAVFAIALIVAALFTPLLSSIIQRSALSGIDQALGFLFGVVRGILLIAVAFIVYDRALSNSSIAAIDESRTAKVFANFQASIDGAIPSDAPGWIVARYNDLTNVCAGEALPAAPAAPAAPTLPEAAPAP
ncbi:CvpA family protein [Xinfangfangia sp. D13-10-4-6]|uniref:CvpA family protein n=1 Tax=Pseudogemmobacter hezensis TaxID=2737662 RepID=UPI001556C622|nr:CvpA family protein [Pseudogemmobacter hezensis]NPD13796.1 CvpA family protein [Pseudogemmobacter hezensis]